MIYIYKKENKHKEAEFRSNWIDDWINVKKIKRNKRRKENNNNNADIMEEGKWVSSEFAAKLNDNNYQNEDGLIWKNVSNHRFLYDIKDKILMDVLFIE